MTGCDSPYNVKLTTEKSLKLGVNNIPVPCGRCLNCKQRRVAQWSIRLMKEMEISTSAYFVTLTYDPLHVPLTENGFMTLCKNSKQSEALNKVGSQTDRSLQGFIKRLRYYELEYKDLYDRKIKKVIERKNIKYYACGEYGSVRRRPHYHLIIFNLSSVESIRKAWATADVRNGITVDWIPFGGYDIGEVNNNTIDYCLKYIFKDNWNRMHKNDDRVKEFSLMSKGLGINFITPEIESFYNKRLDLNYTINQKGHKVPMPRYFRDKMMTEETKEDSMGIIKRAVELERDKEEKRLGKNYDLIKQGGRIQRQLLQKNYSKRNID